MSKKKTNYEFIEEIKKIHGDEYDYSLVEYNGAYSIIKIICPEHGVFEQLARTHLFGSGCYLCKIGTKNTESFIKKAKKMHGDRYDYSLAEYNSSYSKVKIICSVHGIFEQSPSSHIQGRGCPTCKKENLLYYVKQREMKFYDFENKAKFKFSNKYSYNEDNFTNGSKKIDIICPKHGVFSCTPSEHLGGRECPKCSSSSGENEIRAFLIKENIYFEEQKKFKDCRNINPLSFDFYIPEKNLLIEYQGRQHCIPIKYFGGEKYLIEQIKRDEIKREYCKTNNILLKEIKYTETNLEYIIKQLLH